MAMHFLLILPLVESRGGGALATEGIKTIYPFHRKRSPSPYNKGRLRSFAVSYNLFSLRRYADPVLAQKCSFGIKLIREFKLYEPACFEFRGHH